MKLRYYGKNMPCVNYMHKGSPNMNICDLGKKYATKSVWCTNCRKPTRFKQKRTY